MLPLQVLETFEEDDQADDPDAGSSETSFGPHVPVGRDEAGIDRVPIPQHLKRRDHGGGDGEDHDDQ